MSGDNTGGGMSSEDTGGGMSSDDTGGGMSGNDTGGGMSSDDTGGGMFRCFPFLAPAPSLFSGEPEANPTIDQNRPSRLKTSGFIKTFSRVDPKKRKR